MTTISELEAAELSAWKEYKTTIDKASALLEVWQEAIRKYQTAKRDAELSASTAIKGEK